MLLSACARRLAGDALEGAAEGGLGCVTKPMRDRVYCKTVAAQPLTGKPHPKFSRISQWWNTHRGLKSPSKDRAGNIVSGKETPSGAADAE